MTTFLPAIASQVIHEMAGILERFLNRLVSSGHLPQGDYRLLAVAMVGGINEVMAEWLTGQSGHVELLRDEIVHILEAMIKGLAFPQHPWPVDAVFFK